MKITKMTLNKSALAAIFLLMSFAYSINAQAAACETEYTKAVEGMIGINGGKDRETITQSMKERYQRAVTSGKYFMVTSKN